MHEEDIKKFNIMEKFINKHRNSKDPDSEFKVALICGLYLNANLYNEEISDELSKIDEKLKSISNWFTRKMNKEIY